MRLSMPRLPLSLSFMPKENRFFFLLHQSAMNIRVVARRLEDLMQNFENVPDKVQEIKELEELGDQIIHDISHSLRRTFVTPIDREEILALAGRLDDIVDAMDEAAQYILGYKIETPTEYAKQLAAIIVQCADALERAVGLLSTRGTKLKDILPMTEELNRLENEADKVAGRAMSELFSDHKDVVQILKWRDIYSDLEQATDRAEDAADVLEGIVLEHS